MDNYSELFAKGGLSLDRLRTLCLVGEAGSLTGAAHGNTTQVSLFSRQLRELESYFGVRLTRRRGKRIALTEAGQELARLSRLHFGELTDFARGCAGKSPEITFGAPASVMEWLLMPRLPALRKAMRGSQLRLIHDSSASLAARLRDLRLDVAILREEAVISPLKTTRFATLSYALYVPRALAGNARTLLRWLPQLPMFFPGKGWMRDRLDAATAAAGLRLQIEIEGSSTTLALRALREGYYAAILPEIAATELRGADVMILHPAFLRSVERRLVIAWHPRQVDTRAAAAQAVEALKKLAHIA